MAPQRRPYSGLDLFGDLARQSVSNFTTGAATLGAGLVGAPVAAVSWLFPGLSDLGGQRDSLGYAVRSTPAASATALRSRVGTIPGGTTYQEGPTAEIVSRSKGDINYADYPVGVPFSTSKGLFKRNANGSFDRVAPQQFDRATYSSGGGGGGAPARRTAPATSRNTITQAADDDYRQLLSQYGGQAGVSQLAGQTSLPTGFTPEGGKQAASLKDYYAAQQAVGSKNIGDIISSMGYTGPMAEWAKANPMLAQREFAKRQAAAPTSPILGGNLAGFTTNLDKNLGTPLPANAYDFSAPSPIEPMTGFGLNTGLGSVGVPGYREPAFSTGVVEPFKYGAENFGNPANPVVAPPAETQRVLNAPYNQAMAQAGLGLNPDNYSSQTMGTADKVSDFLNQPWLQKFKGMR